MRNRVLFAFLVFSVISISAPIGFAGDYFLYDHEQNKILQLKEDPAFENPKTIGLHKNPDLMMETGMANQFIAVFNSRRDKNEKGQTDYPGKLVIFDAGIGRTEDVVELGFTPYKWVYTKDRLRLFIAYHLSPQHDGAEILCYSLREKKAEKVTGISGEVVALGLTFDENRLLAALKPMKPSKSPAELLFFQMAPFQKKAGLAIGNTPQNLFILGPDRAAVVCAEPKGERARKEFGRIKIIDTNCNAIVEERTLYLPSIGVYWDEKSRSLFVANGLPRNNLIEGRIFKITAAGIRQNQISRPWAGFSYLPEQDRLYVLNDTSLTLIDYQKNSNQVFRLDNSCYYPERYRYYFHPLPGTNLAVIACYEKDHVKFYDLVKNQVLKTCRCGRAGERFLNSLTFKGDLVSRTTVTTNEGQSRFYLLNCATKDITVYDQRFKILKYIVPDEPPLVMFQIKHPRLQTLVVTSKRLYKIDEENITLAPVQDFALDINKVYFLEEKKGWLVFHTDRLLMVLEPESLKMRHSFYLFGDPNEKYTKLKKDERRYYFIPEL